METMLVPLKPSSMCEPSEVAFVPPLPMLSVPLIVRARGTYY